MEVTVVPIIIVELGIVTKQFDSHNQRYWFTWNILEKVTTKPLISGAL